MSKIDRYKILIRYLIKSELIANQKELGKKMGYNNPSAFSQVINGKTSEPKLFMKKLKEIVPELNLSWLELGEGSMLLTGEGEMLNTDSPVPTAVRTPAEEVDATMVLLLPVSAQGGSLNDFVVSVKENDCEKVVSPIRSVDFALTVSGDSMAPEYPNGSRIFVKKINEKAFIEWGKVYVLDTCNGTVIKILAPSEKDNCVRCVSINPDPLYAPFEVRMEDIFGVYKVLLCMAIK